MCRRGRSMTMLPDRYTDHLYTNLVRTMLGHDVIVQKYFDIIGKKYIFHVCNGVKVFRAEVSESDYAEGDDRVLDALCRDDLDEVVPA